MIREEGGGKQWTREIKETSESAMKGSKGQKEKGESWWKEKHGVRMDE